MANTHLQERRNARGLSQSELARKSRVDQGKLSEMENGKRALSLQDAQKLSPHLSVKSSELFARQLGARAAVKAQNAKKGELHRTIGHVQDLLEDADSDDEREALEAVIEELKALADEKDSGEGKPADEDKAEKSQRRSARQGRDAHGRRRRDEDRADVGRDTATKNAARDSEGRKRDGMGRRR